MVYEDGQEKQPGGKGVRLKISRDIDANYELLNGKLEERKGRNTRDTSRPVQVDEKSLSTAETWRENLVRLQDCKAGLQVA